MSAGTDRVGRGSAFWVCMVGEGSEGPALLQGADGARRRVYIYTKDMGCTDRHLGDGFWVSVAHLRFIIFISIEAPIATASKKYVRIEAERNARVSRK